MTAAIEQASTTEVLLEDLEGTTQADPSAQAKEEQSQPTLQDQVRADSDFAWDQITKRDAKISELANQAKQFEVVDPYIRAAGGPEQLLNLASQAQQIQQVPGLSEIVQKALSDGRVVEPVTETPNDQEEEWMDEDTKKVRDAMNARFEGLEQRFDDLSSIASSASVRSHESQIERNIESVVNLFSATDEGKEEALKLIHDSVTVAQRQAEGGNSQQQSMIAQLAGPKGEGVLKFMLMEAGLFEKYGAKIFAPKDTRNEDEAPAALVRSTDGKVINPSRPAAPELPPLPKGRVTTNYAQQVLHEIQRRRGRSVT